MRRWVLSVGSAVLVAVPAIGVAILSFRTALARDVPKQRLVWALVIAAPLLIPVPFQWFSGRSGSWLIWHSAALALFGIVCGGNRRWIVRGVFAGLALLSVAGLATEPLRAKLLTEDSSTLQSAFRGVSRLEPRTMYWSVAKEWTVPEKTELAVLAFDVRRSAGSTGTDWYRNSPAVHIEPCSEAEMEACSRITIAPPSVETGSIAVSRELDTRSPLANRRFRLTALIRSDQPQNTQGCSGLVLQEVAGRYRGECAELELSTAWNSYQVEWQAPADTEGSEIRVLVNGLSGSYEIAGVTIEEGVPGHWQELGPLEPQGLIIGVRPLGSTRREANAHSIFPSPEWTPVNIVLPTKGSTHNGVLRINFQTEGGLGLEIRGLELREGEGGPKLAPIGANRWALGFGQPNLLGHSAAVAGVVGGALAGSAPLTVASLALAAFLIIRSGSRTALLALAIGALFLLILRWRGWKRLVLLAMVSASALAAFTLWPGVVQRFTAVQDGNVVQRTDIWRLAGQALVSAPLVGLGDEEFLDHWVRTESGWANSAPVHAHNLLLQFGAQFGVPGAIAILLLLGLMLVRLWKRLRWDGVALFLTLIVLNATDFSFFFPGVLATVLLAAGSTRDAAEVTPRMQDKNQAVTHRADAVASRT